MTKSEFLANLKREGIVEFYAYDGIKRYIEGEMVYFDNEFHNTYSVYGVYQRQDNQYIAFITDSERGLTLIEKKFDSESKAFEFLYSRIKIYKQLFPCK